MIINYSNLDLEELEDDFQEEYSEKPFIRKMKKEEKYQEKIKQDRQKIRDAKRNQENM